MDDCGCDSGCGDCHRGVSGGHRPLLQEGQAPREGVQKEEQQASLWCSGETTGDWASALR